MKILQLCNKNPYPPIDGGAIAVLNLAISLARKGHEVFIMAMDTEKHKNKLSTIPYELSSLIKFISFPVDTRIRPLSLLLNLLFSKQPYNALRFHNKNFEVKIEELLRKEQFDLVQLEGLYLKWYIDIIRQYHKGKIAYRAHNIENEIWKGNARNSKNPLKRFYLKNLSRRLQLYEMDIINRYDILLPISESDQATFQEMGNKKPVHLTYTNISEEGFNEIKNGPIKKDLFYIGALDWIPNQEGIIWFLEKVWITLKKSHPDLEFHVAGRNAPVWLAQKCKEFKAVFHGEVENALHFFDQQGIMIVPLFAGSGLRIKIIEAMARSKVIITTSKGAQGLHLSGNEILIADTPEQMNEQIHMLLDDPNKYKQLQSTAYDFAQQNFSSSFIVDKLLYFYEQQGLC